MIYVYYWFTVDFKFGVRLVYYFIVIIDIVNEKEIKLFRIIEVLDLMIFKISLLVYLKVFDVWL